LDKISVTFRGNGITFCRHGFSAEEWNAVTAKTTALNSSVEECWFLDDFHDAYSGNSLWTDYSNLSSVNGLILDSKGIIEIKINGRRKAKIVAVSLIQNNLLFSIYSLNLREVQTSENVFPVVTEAVEMNIGMTGRIGFTTDHPLNPDLLEFNVVQLMNPRLLVLESMIYNSIIHKLSKPDFLVTGQYLKIINIQ
jgi:hypothetical protein